ncbi:hypothetical protein EMIHUDRAFT_441194 [Emiliania huxleyi CCMP1516]|uniref:Mitochondrial carrier protein n=2 Tax=Emiliania huxleyi TaxID=2903 RepID=A0A0D3KFU0_EMIH1|nr:hypothetical protein EMIHUDRAFT_441194 [Emiliania huxleyi CCMP1516]EOD34625.1 hypothetical protein EMIHUDRAFT_441194 [Emiliania huxleyi CCMP1516]|eukprot:XP_005787054.1 hypothetical protein EMIHUDRAFT_441194 [Emiliania huxleyi CCMP1516]
MPLDAKGRQKIASTNPDSAEEASLLEKAAASDDPSVLAGEARPSPSPLLLPARGVFAAFVLLVVIIGWLSARYGPPAKERRPAGSVGEIVYSASRKALGGGLSGAAAGVAQVILLMWLRTTMNYQYRHGSSTCAAMRTLYAHGGVSRFYQGLPYALLQTPLSRFGDTAANTGVLALLSSTAAGGALPVALRTALASAAAALWRVAITPLDTLKTALQVEGRGAYELLLRRAKQNGACELWAGALASAAANFVPRVVRRFWSPPGDCLVSPCGCGQVGGYPWFLTFNALDELLPRAEPAGPRLLLRSATLGVCAAAVSDCLSNSIRVVKTTRQTAEAPLSYEEAAELVLRQDGLRGLLCRGLGTRLLANIVQAALFTVIWKQLEAGMRGRGLA